MARPDPIAHLSRHQLDLPPTLVREVRGRLPAELPRLIALATDPHAWVEGEEGWVAAFQAMRFLADVHTEPSREALLVVFRGVPDPEDPLVGRAAWALARHGPAVVEPVLPLAQDGDRWTQAVGILVATGAREPRIVERLEAVIVADPGLGAMLAETYGDPCLFPALERALETLDRLPDPDEEEIHAKLSLIQALAALAGDDPARRARIQARQRAEAEEDLQGLEALRAMLHDPLRGSDR